MPSIYGPGGSRVVSGDPNVSGSFRIDESLSPEQRKLYEGRTGVAQSLLDRSSTAMKGLPVSYEWEGASDPATNRLFTEQQKMLDRVYGRQEEDLTQSLSNRGLPEGSEAHGEAVGDFRRGRAEDYERAAAGALEAGSWQSLGERQQKLNEVAQALGGSQLTPVGQGGNPIDVNSAFAAQQAARNQQYQHGVNAANMNQNASNSLQAGLFGLGTAAMFSDRRLKRDITLVGTFMPEVGWYSYRYLWDSDNTPLRFGVMADELERVIPEAVTYDLDGFASVDYRWILHGKALDGRKVQ